MIGIAIIFISLILNVVLYQEKERQRKLTESYKKLLHNATETNAKFRLEKMEKRWNEKQQ